MRQDDTPVFKLISPDDNGGSNEVIIFNAEIKDGPYNNRSKVIGDVNKPIIVKAAIETDPILQGSYNYSETTTHGLGRTRKTRCQAARSRLLLLRESARSVLRASPTKVSGSRSRTQSPSSGRTRR